MLKLWAVQHNMSPPPKEKPPMGRLPKDKKVEKKKDPIESEPADELRPIEFWLEKYPITEKKNKIDKPKSHNISSKTE